jgi:hypothetical protein
MRVGRSVAFGAAFAVFLQFAAGTAVHAQAEGRKVALVQPVVLDSSATPPAGFSAGAMQREMEVALESTGLFTVPTHDKAELKGVIDEKVRQKARSSGAGQKASLVLNPTIETISFGERRRLAPMNRGKDAVSAEGQVSMTVQVLNVSDGSVATRMQIDAPYHGPERLADPLANDPLAGRGATANSAYHGAASPEEWRAFYQETGRVFAKRVLDQVSPTLVAQRADDKLYLTRGQDAGYRVGDMLRVIRRGDPIRNPVTHEVIGTTEAQIGTAKVVEVQPRMTIAQIVKSTKDIAQGDAVKDVLETDN